MLLTNSSLPVFERDRFRFCGNSQIAGHKPGCDCDVLSTVVRVMSRGSERTPCGVIYEVLSPLENWPRWAVTKVTVFRLD